jgi:tetraacyldisaccharide 4'-kinase
VAISEPSWWYDTAPRWQTIVLRPAARIYGVLAARRLSSGNAYRSRCPVICVGNFTAGGTGKTPAALAVAGIVRGLGGAPVFLTRGYGGRLAGPVEIDPKRHGFADTGDEPLLLAETAPTIIAKDRAKGAALIDRTASDNTVIIMDDGLQNPTLVKDLSIALIDAKRGFGNGAVIPAGPLRAPIDAQIALADCVIVNGDPTARELDAIAAALPRLHAGLMRARVVPAPGSEALAGKRVVAFAGIANPKRFFDLVDRLGADVRETVVFADHHAFSEADAGRLLALAGKAGASLVTTQKDLVRLRGLANGGELVSRTTALPIKLELLDDDRKRLTALIESRMKARRAQP